MPDIVSQYLPVIVAALIILLLLVIALLTWRALSPRMSARRGQRLGISEYYEIDKTRRLVLVRRDDVEHLLLIGGPQDLVVEQGVTIAPPVVAHVPKIGTEAPSPGLATQRAPRPPVFGDRRSPPLRAAPPVEPVMPTPTRGEDSR